MEIEIRQANSSDQSFIISSQLRMAEETEGLILDEGVVEAGVAHLLQNPLLGFYLIAGKEGEKFACLLVLKEWSDWRNGEVWWIHSLYVMPKHRRMGVFSMMYDHLRSRVEMDAGVHGLRLYVDKRNQRAMMAYENVGMDSQHYAMFEWLK